MNIKENKPQSGGRLVRSDAAFRPLLTKQRIEELLGEKFGNIVMYNLNTNELSPRMYNEHFVVGARQMSDMVVGIKTNCSTIPTLADREPVAVFAKTYDCNYTNTFIDRRFFITPPYNANGKCIAGNIIFFNKATGMCEALPHGWFYAGGKNCRGSASEEAILSVMKLLAGDVLQQQRRKTK